jgi:hypothetical protein
MTEYIKKIPYEMFTFKFNPNRGPVGKVNKSIWIASCIINEFLLNILITHGRKHCA